MLPRNHPDIFDGEARLGGVLVQEGRFQEAEPLLLTAYHGLEPVSQSAAKRLALQSIVEMYTDWSHRDKSKADEVATWKTLESQIR